MNHAAAPIFVFLFLGLLSLISSYHLDPSDYFTGAQHRPKLQIVHPENGQVLDDVNLEITIKIDGYEVPSNFHNSQVCVGLSTGLSFAEHVSGSEYFWMLASIIYHASLAL